MAKKGFGCEREECCSSTSIAGSATFGTGKLDSNGYWEHPCEICEQAWRKHERECGGEFTYDSKKECKLEKGETREALITTPPPKPRIVIHNKKLVKGEIKMKKKMFNYVSTYKEGVEVNGIMFYSIDPHMVDLELSEEEATKINQTISDYKIISDRIKKIVKADDYEIEFVFGLGPLLIEKIERIRDRWSKTSLVEWKPKKKQ